MRWNRLAAQCLRYLASQFPAVVLIGPRQVGKTTLAKAVFSDADYKDIESPLTRIRYTEAPLQHGNPR